MLRNAFIVLVLAAFAVIPAYLLFSFEPNESLQATARHYAGQGPSEVGAPNLVTAVVVTYRGLDTLGEVTILFLTAAIIGFLLKTSNGSTQSSRSVSEILTTASRVLVPVIVLFGIYVFMNGHLTPGGGFQGGAILASAAVLFFLAHPSGTVPSAFIHRIEAISGFSYVLIGLLGLLLAGGFLDNALLPLGRFGSLFSAGAIPLIYLFIGLKVGAELTGIVGSFNRIQKEEA